MAKAVANKKTKIMNIYPDLHEECRSFDPAILHNKHICNSRQHQENTFRGILHMVMTYSNLSLNYTKSNLVISETHQLGLTIASVRIVFDPK